MRGANVIDPDSRRGGRRVVCSRRQEECTWLRLSTLPRARTNRFPVALTPRPPLTVHCASPVLSENWAAARAFLAPLARSVNQFQAHRRSHMIPKYLELNSLQAKLTQAFNCSEIPKNAATLRLRPALKCDPTRAHRDPTTDIPHHFRYVTTWCPAARAREGGSNQ